MRNAVFSLVAIGVTALLTFWLIFDPFHKDWTVPAFHFSVTHTVLFQFKEDADPQAIRNVLYNLYLFGAPVPPMPANMMRGNRHATA